MRSASVLPLSDRAKLSSTSANISVSTLLAYCQRNLIVGSSFDISHFKPKSKTYKVFDSGTFYVHKIEIAVSY